MICFSKLQRERVASCDGRSSADQEREHGDDLRRDRPDALAAQDVRHAGGIGGCGNGRPSSDQLRPVAVQVASTREEDHVE